MRSRWPSAAHQPFDAPFYNERAVHLLLALAGVVVVVLTAFNAIRIIALSRQNTELSSLINRDHDEAQRLTREAQRIRAGINQAELEATANAAALANSLIDQRTFSWTEFFNHIEETLPPDVMLTSVRPSFTDNVTTIQMTVLGRRSEDLDEFMEKLEATGRSTQCCRPSGTPPTGSTAAAGNRVYRRAESLRLRFQQNDRRREARAPAGRNPRRRRHNPRRRPRNPAAPPAEGPADDRPSPDRPGEPPHRLHPRGSARDQRGALRAGRLPAVAAGGERRTGSGSRPARSWRPERRTTPRVEP